MDKTYVPKHPTGKTLIRQQHSNKPKPKPPTHVVPQSPVPTVAKTTTKTAALARIDAAGLDEKAFSKALDAWVSTGLVRKEGQQYLIPESFVTSYIIQAKTEDGDDDD
jgi:hypothetical protein